MLGRFCLAELNLRSHLLNKIQFTFEVVPCLILGLFSDFFTGVHQFWPSVTRGWVVGKRGGVDKGGRWGGRWQKLPGEDTGPPVALTWS